MCPCSSGASSGDEDDGGFLLVKHYPRRDQHLQSPAIPTANVRSAAGESGGRPTTTTTPPVVPLTPPPPTTAVPPRPHGFDRIRTSTTTTSIHPAFDSRSSSSILRDDHHTNNEQTVGSSRTHRLVVDDGDTDEVVQTQTTLDAAAQHTLDTGTSQGRPAPDLRSTKDDDYSDLIQFNDDNNNDGDSDSQSATFDEEAAAADALVDPSNYNDEGGDGRAYASLRSWLMQEYKEGETVDKCRAMVT
eukprot:1195312-Prorocentrum_minimum.AAC.10